MENPNPHFAKSLARREARARRPNKMRWVLFYVFFICASATLRLYPEMAEYVVLTPENTHQKNLQPSKRHLQPQGSVKLWPKDRIKVRRGIRRQLESDAIDSQAMAKKVEKMLSKMQAGHYQPALIS